MAGEGCLLGWAASREKSLSGGIVDGKCYNFSGGEMEHYHIYRPLEFPWTLAWWSRTRGSRSTLKRAEVLTVTRRSTTAEPSGRW